MAKIANLRPKTGQIPILSLDINLHNSIIFHPILTFFIWNCLFSRDESNGVQIKAPSLLVNFLVFGPIFAPRPHMRKIVRAWTQNRPKKVGTCPALPLQPVSHNWSFQNYRPELGTDRISVIRLNPDPAGYPASISGSGSDSGFKNFAGFFAGYFIF